MILKSFHRVKRYLFAFGVLVFSLFLAGSQFLSSSASAIDQSSTFVLSNTNIYRTLVTISGAGSQPQLINEMLFRTGVTINDYEVIGTSTPFVALQGLRLISNGTFGDASYRSNVISLIIAIRQGSGPSNNTLEHTVPFVTARYSGGQTLGTCNDGVIRGGNTLEHRIDYECEIVLPEYTSANQIEFFLGRTTATRVGDYIPYYALFNSMLNTYPINGREMYLDSRVTVSSTQDASISILNQQTQIMNQQLQQQQESNRLQQEQNDFLTDDTPPSADTSVLADSAGWLPAGPVDSILTIPITFLNGIISALGNDNCRPVSIPLPFVGGNINLPCLRPILNDMGFLTIYNVVGGIVGMFIIYDTLKWLYKFVDDTLSFREDNNTIWGGL